MRYIFTFLVLMASTAIYSQSLAPSVVLESKKITIAGTILDSKTGKPLEYASVGIVNTPFGGVTNTNGEFAFEAQGLLADSKIRISMIGYAPQVYKLDEYNDKNGKISLVETPFIIPEVIIKPYSKVKKVGATSFDRFGEWCGWGGIQFGKGYEDGIRIDLGEKPVLISSLNVRILRQAFDTSYYRLHIRSFSNNMVAEELLKSNIIITLIKESGWEEVNLEKYNLVFSGEIALSLEWLNVKGVNENRAMVINRKLKKEYILFRTKKNNLGLFRNGVEANWYVNSAISPAIYLKVKE